MGQTTLDDEDLFDEAANEMRADVEEALQKARAAVPDPDSIWDADADNALGVLNGLKTALDTDDAADHLRDAKKWYTMGKRADAFENADDLKTDIEELEELFETTATAREQASDLAAVLPGLRDSLDDAHNAAEDDTKAEAE